ncbi:MAG: carboxypeptidase-like regulatory domain-containing protein [Bryobacteraceae bacterium]
METSRACLLAGCALLLTAGLLRSQAPTGQINGSVLDESGALVPDAVLTLTNRGTGAMRTDKSNHEGLFSFPSLQSGNYELRSTATGFRVLVRPVTVETGQVVTVQMQMQVGASKEVVTVEAASAQVEYDSHTIDGVVERKYIDSLPLNGRSFLQLAMIEPGVTVSAGALGQYNRQFDVNILGQGSETVRITVDGATVNDSVTGGTQQNFSQEVVQEFQVSMLNFDLSTGITGSGAVNVVTRGGTNDIHGTGYFFYRDHNLSAYPYLARDPSNPDPYFVRRQPGVQIGGPIKKNKLFFFGSYEHTAQTSVDSAIPSNPLFAKFGDNTPSPYHGNLVGGRVDWALNSSNSVFVRYSHDGNNAYAPSGGGTQPSNWAVNKNFADSAVASWISSIKPTLVNEFRYSLTYWDNTKNPPTATVCPPPCIGLGGPQFSIDGINNFQIGNDANNTPQSRNLTRHIFADNMTWSRGSHRIKFGGEWENQKGDGTYAYAEPAGVVLYSPEEVAQSNEFYQSIGVPLQIQIPSTFNTLSDILQLPVAGFATGVGDINQPPSYHRNIAEVNNRFHFYAQDTWKIRPRFTLNYGLAYSYETFLLNHDLTKPAYLEPILGANGLGPEEHMPHNFTPMLGFNWSPGKDNKTVIRGGGGIYYDTMNIEVRLLERAAIGPLGTGRVLLSDNVFYSDISQLFGFADLFNALGITNLQTIASPFTGAELQGILPVLRAGAAQTLHQNPNNTDLTLRNINVFKAAPGLDMFTRDFRTPYSEHASVGVQHQLSNDMVISADFVFRQFMHQRIRNTDLNHYNSIQGPVIPACTGTEAQDPLAECSQGRMDFNVSGARSNYKGLLVKLDKRFSRRFQFTTSYAYQRAWGYNGLINDSNWFASNGPQIGHHLLNVAGVVELPKGFQISLISAFQSRGPFEPSIPGIDLDGNGMNGVPLPGAGYNQFGVNYGSADLIKYVNAFNQQYAGKLTPLNQKIPFLTLPSKFDLGEPFNSQDFRVTKTFNLSSERWRFLIMGEVFNAFNLANVGGMSGNLTDSGFGLPTTRFSSIFGSGGPRAFQFGARLVF